MKTFLGKNHDFLRSQHNSGLFRQAQIVFLEINQNLTFCSVLDEPTYDDLESSNVSMCSGSVNEILDQVRLITLKFNIFSSMSIQA